MILEILKKIIPTKAKHSIAQHLRTIIYPAPELSPIVHAGKPGSMPNLWWDELEKISNKQLFPGLTSTAQQACAEIREAYKPILEHYGVNADDFFWGSIKNEEAEALYQLVLDRKPKVAYQIGTFVGYSALVIAHALRANGEGILIAVDPEIPHRTFINPVNIARDAATSQGLTEYIRFERGWHSGPLGDYLGLTLKRSIPIVGLEVMASIRKEGIDLAFIDGDHSSACTLTDFLLLKDYLNIKGIAIFHDVLSWPTVAQAIFLLWHDIHYYVRGTAAYFSLDTRKGQDGLAILERIAHEHCPTLCLKLINTKGEPISGARVELPSIGLIAISDADGTIYAIEEVLENSELLITHTEYQDFQDKLSCGTHGDYAEITVTLLQ